MYLQYKEVNQRMQLYLESRRRSYQKLVSLYAPPAQSKGRVCSVLYCMEMCVCVCVCVCVDAVSFLAHTAPDQAVSDC